MTSQEVVVAARRQQPHMVASQGEKARAECKVQNANKDNIGCSGLYYQAENFLSILTTSKSIIYECSPLQKLGEMGGLKVLTRTRLSSSIQKSLTKMTLFCLFLPSSLLPDRV
jgi:hypothetical protein